MKSTIAKAKQFLALLVACAAAATAAGCAGPEIDGGGLSPEIFTATIEQEGATKTVLDAKTGATRQVRWQDSEKIALYGASDDYTMASLVSTGSTAAYFTGSGAQKDGGKYKAYYPATIYNSTTGKLTFPEEQSYGGLSDGKAVVSNLPMYAESATTDLDFKNLCSVLNFQLTGEATDKVTEIVVTTSAAGQYLSGEFTIGGTPASAPTMVMTGASGSTASVTLDCTGAPGGGVALSSTPTDFFVAIPAQTYAAGTLTIKVKNGSKTLATLRNTTATAAQEQFQRNTIYEIAKQAEEPVFSVTHASTTTPSTGTNVDVDRTATAITFNADTLHFAVTTNLGGYTVEILDAGMNVNATIVPNPPSSNTSGDDLSAPVVVSNNLNLSSFTDPGLTVFEPFTVGAANQEVFFSPGNLQYQASVDGVTAAGNWRFAPRQWEWVGDDSHGNVYTSSTAKSTNTVEPESAREFYTGWIDLFGWGATGQQYSTNASHRYQPWAYTGTNYGPSGSVDLSGQSDWGYNMGGGYRTITRTEWAYVINTRGSGSTYMRYMRAELDFAAADRTFYVRFKAKDDDQYSVTYKFTQEKGPNVYGVILFPDDFETNHATEAALCAGSYNSTYTLKKLSTADWLTLQGAGCVFLPQTGSRQANTSTALSSLNYGDYWSSSYNGSGYAYCFYFTNSDGASLQFYQNASSYRYRGKAVRLVRGTEFTGDTEPYQPGGNSGF